jgi:hypothetical protein
LNLVHILCKDINDFCLHVWEPALQAFLDDW